MKKSWKMVLLLAVLVALLAGAYSYYLYNKPHDDMASKTPEFTLSAQALIDAYAADETASNAKFSGKIIEVSGVVVVKSEGTGGSYSISLGDAMSGVSCTVDSADVAPFKTILDKITEGDTVIFRGRCDGMLTDVQLSRCVPITK